MTCGKRGYSSRKDAKRAIKYFNTRFKDNNLTDVYWCEECSYYHLTSMPKQQSRDYRRFLNKKK